MYWATRAFCTFMQTALMFFMLLYPYRHRLRYSAKKTWGLVSIFIISYTALYCIVGFEPQKLGTLRIFYSCLIIMIQSTFIAHLIRLRFPIAIFAVYCVRNLTDSLMMATRLIDQFIISDYFPLRDFIPFIYLIFLALFTPVVVVYISRAMVPNMEYAHLKIWRLLWIVPFIFYIFFRVFSTPEYFRQMIPWSATSVLLPFIWFFGTSVSHYVILRLMLETAQMTTLREQLSYSELLSAAQRREYMSLQENIEQTKKFRHDMRHHFVALDGYLSTSDVTAARSYIASLNDTLESYKSVCYCSNYAVNSLLNHYLEKAAKNQIQVSLSVDLEKNLPLADTDFCCILGNLFDNAIDACSSHNIPNPFISLTIGYAGAAMPIISIRNSYSGEILIENGDFLSSKRSERGIGTASVKYLVAKYDGICRFSHQNNVFEASILLNPSITENTQKMSPTV